MKIEKVGRARPFSESLDFIGKMNFGRAWSRGGRDR